MNNLLQRHPDLDSGSIHLTDCYVGLCPHCNDGGRVVALSKVPRRPRATLWDPVSSIDSRTTCENDGGRVVALSKVPCRPRAMLGDPVSLIDSRTTCENDGGRVVVLSKVPRRPRATLGDPVSLIDSRTTCENDGKLEVLRQVQKYLPLFYTAFDMKGGKLCCQ